MLKSGLWLDLRIARSEPTFIRFPCTSSMNFTLQFFWGILAVASSSFTTIAAVVVFPLLPTFSALMRNFPFRRCCCCGRSCIKSSPLLLGLKGSESMMMPPDLDVAELNSSTRTSCIPKPLLNLPSSSWYLVKGGVS